MNNLLRTLLPCDVIIGRLGPLHAVERDILISFGMPGFAAQGYRLSDCLRTLQAQRDYMLSHLGMDEYLPSVDVEHQQVALPEDDVQPCLFYTSCGLQLRQDHNQICFRRPWRIFDPARPNCWYGTGVSCTLGPTNVNDVIRDPRELVEEHQRIVQAVQRRAYEIWEERGHENSNDWAHWFQARHELGIPDNYYV